MKTILVTGGAGFAGSNICISLKKDFENIRVLALDNLKRRGSELNLPRLKKFGVEFIHGDIRNKEDLFSLSKVDTIIECSAEPSVLAGYNSSPEYLISTNLLGTINCLELARRDSSDFIFLSTSRVYPIATINSLLYTEDKTRFELLPNQTISGASEKGYSEEFPIYGVRSLYGTTKLSSEMLLQEYIATYKIRGVINRCGVLTGPWQMGKVDQGVIVFWAANHIYNKKLSYFGYGGTGKQVRDILHIDDLYHLIKLEMKHFDSINGEIYNVGGGREVSTSLLELTNMCSTFSKHKINVDSVVEDRVGDIRIYLTDHSKVTAKLGWKPTISTTEIIEEIIRWIKENKKELEPILG